jgi:hypothetical protein
MRHFVEIIQAIIQNSEAFVQSLSWELSALFQHQSWGVQGSFLLLPVAAASFSAPCNHQIGTPLLTTAGNPKLKVWFFK